MGSDSGPLSDKVRPLAILTSETNMRLNACDAEKRTAIRTDLGVTRRFVQNSTLTIFRLMIAF